MCSNEPVEFLVGGSDLLASLEQALQGHKVGDTVELQLEPQHAFGDYDDRLLFLEPRHLFPAEIEEGMGFEGLPDGCNPAAPKDRLYFVSDIYPDHVVLDGNHPLAGMALRITLKVHAVRDAQVSEVGKGSLGTGFFPHAGGPGRRSQPPRAPHTALNVPHHQHKGLHEQPFVFRGTGTQRVPVEP